MQISTTSPSLGPLSNNQNELSASLSLAGVAPGKYEVFVENDTGRRSTPTPFEVSPLPTRPSIIRSELSPGLAVVDKSYTYLRLYASNIKTSTRVLISNKVYTGKVTIKIGEGRNGTYAEIPGFSSKGFTRGNKSFKLRNTVGGKSVDSYSYNIFFDDPAQPSASSVRFTLNGLSTTGRVGKVYDTATFYGRNLSQSTKLFVDGKEVTGNITKSSSTFVVKQYSTIGMKTGSHGFYFVNVLEGKKSKSNTVSFTLQDGETPVIQSLRSSDTSDTKIYSNRKYTYLLIRGQNFLTGIKIILDGVPHAGPILVEKETSIYMYQVDTSNLLPGNHTLILENTIAGKPYRSKLFLFNVYDGSLPTITSLSITPSSLMYPGEVYTINIRGRNIRTGALLLFDGKEYQGTYNATTSTVIVPSFDTTGLSVGTHSFQLRNVINGKNYDSAPRSVSIRNRPAPRITGFTPPSIPEGTTQTIQVRGYNFSSKTVLEMDGAQIKTTYINPSNLSFVADGKQMSARRYQITAVNPDGQKSPPMPFDVFPDVGPVLWSITPKSWSVSQTTSVRINLYGFNLVSGSKLLIDKKAVTSIQSSQPNYAYATLPFSATAKAGTYSLTVQDATGKTSNALELVIDPPQSKPEIYRTSPTVLYNTSPRTLYVYGQGLQSGRAIACQTLTNQVLKSHGVTS